MGCDSTLRLKRINLEDFDCLPTATKSDDLNRIKSAKSQNTSIPNVNMTLYALSSERLQKDSFCSNSPDKYHVESHKNRIESNLPKLGLISKPETKQSATIWHKHNSPLSSPTKSPIHSARSKN